MMYHYYCPWKMCIRDREYPIFSEYAKALEIQYGSDFMEIPDPSKVLSNHEMLELIIDDKKII